MFIKYLRLPFREDNLFGLLLLSLFFCPLFFLPIISDAFDGAKTISFFIACGLGWIVYTFRSNREFRLNKLFLYATGVFTLFYILSTILSIDVRTSVLETYRFTNSLIFILAWLSLIFFISLVNNKDKILVLCRTFVVSGTLVAILGIIHSFGILFYLGAGGGDRPIFPGFIGNQNFSAMYVVGVIPLIFPLLLRSKSKIAQFLYGACGFVMLWSVMIFASRAAILGLFVAALFGLGLLIIKKLPKQIIFGMILTILIAGMLAFLFYSRTSVPTTDTSLQFKKDVTSQERLSVWKKSLILIGRNPIFGIGPGNLHIGIRGFDNAAALSVEKFDDSHNALLNLGANTGLPALVGFCLMLLVAFKSSMLSFWKNNSELSWSLAIALIGFGISMLFGPVSISNWILLAFLIAASQHVERERFIAESTELWKKLIIVIGGILFIGVGISLLLNAFISIRTESAYRSGDYNTAIKFAKYELWVSNIHSHALQYIAASNIKLNRNPAEVRQDIGRFASSAKLDPSTQLTTAKFYFLLHEYSKDNQDSQAVIEHIQKLNQEEPNYAPNLLISAYILYEMGEKDQAKSYIEQALPLDKQGQTFFAYILLAEIQLEQGQKDQMFHSIQEAYKLEPNSLLEGVMKQYQAGTFTATQIPVHFPPVEI